MKIWITDRDDYNVMVHTKKPRLESVYYDDEKFWVSDSSVDLCRQEMKKLLRGSGKRLPKLGSIQITEVELIVR